MAFRFNPFCFAICAFTKPILSSLAQLERGVRVIGIAKFQYIPAQKNAKNTSEDLAENGKIEVICLAILGIETNEMLSRAMRNRTCRT